MERKRQRVQCAHDDAIYRSLLLLLLLLAWGSGGIHAQAVDTATTHLLLRSAQRQSPPTNQHIHELVVEATGREAQQADAEVLYREALRLYNQVGTARCTLHDVNSHPICRCLAQCLSFSVIFWYVRVCYSTWR